MVEKAGISKSFAAIPYIQGDTIRDMLQLCIETPYHSLRAALQDAYPQSAGRRRRSSKSQEELRQAAERSAVRVIVDNEKGMIGRPGIFVPRQYRQDAEDELRAQEVFDIAMRRLGTDDRDAFFMRVVELVSNTWLTKDDRQASSSFCRNNDTDHPFLDMATPPGRLPGAGGSTEAAGGSHATPDA